MIQQLNLIQPTNALATSLEDGLVKAKDVGYPLVVRPSYVLGGRAMEIVYNEDELRHYLRTAVQASNEAPVLLDRFLDDAIEVDVDCVSDGTDVVIGGIISSSFLTLFMLPVIYSFFGRELTPDEISKSHAKTAH